MKKFLLILCSMFLLVGCNSENQEIIESQPDLVDETTAETAVETTEEKVTKAVIEEITADFLEDVHFKYELTDTGLNVYKISNRMGETGGLHQQLEVEIKTRSDNIKEIVIPNDYDFDGYGDIAVRTYLAATNAVFRYFRYNPDTDRFESWSELDDLHFYVKTNSDKTLSVYSKSSAVDAEDIVYKWSGDVLVPVSKEKKYWNAEGIFMDYIEYDDFGNETLVKREKYIYDENGDVTGTVDVTP